MPSLHVLAPPNWNPFRLNSLRMRRTEEDRGKEKCREMGVAKVPPTPGLFAREIPRSQESGAWTRQGSLVKGRSLCTSSWALRHLFYRPTSPALGRGTFGRTSSLTIYDCASRCPVPREGGILFPDPCTSCALHPRCLSTCDIMLLLASLSLPSTHARRES